MKSDFYPTGPWTLAQLRNGDVGFPKNGMKVFSCFHCGGGSTMGYKLAGFDVLGGVEIDPEMMKIYRKNHNPKHSYLMGVQEFKEIPNESLPPELFQLDILDGSPPCSSFSMAGSREKTWGEKKKFREGQVAQVLDDLFFDFIAIAKKLQPKVVVAENVKGLMAGNARGYVKEIFEKFRDAGYSTQLFLLNASRMGAPQRRERTFFVATREQKLKLDFNEETISLAKALSTLLHEHQHQSVNDKTRWLWERCEPGKNFSTVHAKGHRWNWSREHMNLPCRTMASTSAKMILHPMEPRTFCKSELCAIQTFPQDYDFLEQDPGYVCGMSVPPFMTQRLAIQIYEQILSKNMRLSVLQSTNE